MPELLTRARMAANIAQSQGHIVKQDAIIVRLVAQGHDVMAEEAKGLLVSMHEHLALELEILDRMEGDAAKLLSC